MQATWEVGRGNGAIGQMRLIMEHILESFISSIVADLMQNHLCPLRSVSDQTPIKPLFPSDPVGSLSHASAKAEYTMYSYVPTYLEAA